MRIRNRRWLASIRARMTLGFVIVLAPCLLALSGLLPGLADRATALVGREQVGWIVERASASLDQPKWQARLTKLVEARLPKESHVAVLIVSTDDRILWRSQGPGPAWPPAGFDWRREV